MTRTKQDNIKTKLDGKKVVITSGKYQHKAGRVLRGQAFIARGRLTLVISGVCCGYGKFGGNIRFYATPKQVEVINGR